MKKNFKSLVALLLALVMVLSACGNGGSKTKETETEKPATGLKGEISVQVEEAWKPYYETVAKKITEANPDVKINFITSGSVDHIDIIDKTNAENPDVADVFALPADRFDGFAANEVLGAIPALDMANALGGFGDYEKGLGGAFKVGEEFLAFPYNIETLVVFANTKNAEANGVDLTKPVDLATLSQPETVLLPMFDAWYGVAPLNAGGIEFLVKDGDSFKSTFVGKYEELTADQKAVFDGMFAYWKQHKDANTALFDTQTGYGYTDTEFATGGKGVFRIDGPWATNSGIIKDEIEKGNVSILPISHITVSGKPLAHWQGGWALGVNSRIESDKDKLAIAVEFIKGVVNPENAAELYKATGKILENANLDTYKNSDLSDTDKLVIERVLESFAVSTPRPLFKEFGNVWSTWENAVISWNSSNPSDAATAYNEINAAFTAMFEQLK